MVFMAEAGFEIAHWPHLEAWAARLNAIAGVLGRSERLDQAWGRCFF
jgi:hypothetical protein